MAWLTKRVLLMLCYYTEVYVKSFAVLDRMAIMTTMMKIMMMMLVLKSICFMKTVPSLRVVLAHFTNLNGCV